MADVAVFWDYENCSINVASLNLGYDIVNAIRRSICNTFGPIKIFKAYLELPEHSSPRFLSLRSELQASGVSLTDCPHNGRKDVADKMILVDMMAFCLDNPPPATIVLISGDRDFAYALSTLRHRQYQIVVLAPPVIHVSLLAQASFVVDWHADILGKATGERGVTEVQTGPASLTDQQFSSPSIRRTAPTTRQSPQNPLHLLARGQESSEHSHSGQTAVSPFRSDKVEVQAMTPAAQRDSLHGSCQQVPLEPGDDSRATLRAPREAALSEGTIDGREDDMATIVRGTAIQTEDLAGMLLRPHHYRSHSVPHASTAPDRPRHIRMTAEETRNTVRSSNSEPATVTVAAAQIRDSFRTKLSLGPEVDPPTLDFAEPAANHPTIRSSAAPPVMHPSYSPRKHTFLNDVNNSFGQPVKISAGNRDFRSPFNTSMARPLSQASPSSQRDVENVASPSTQRLLAPWRPSGENLSQQSTSTSAGGSSTGVRAVSQPRERAKTQSSMPAKEHVEPPRYLLPSKFVSLVLQLQNRHQAGDLQPLRSAVAFQLVQQDKQVYRNAGVEKFSQYAALAETAGIVELGGTCGAEWIKLSPVWLANMGAAVPK